MAGCSTLGQRAAHMANHLRVGSAFGVMCGLVRVEPSSV